ncbi:TNT domain-containing protein [Ruminococcus sp.]|uniref:TNT domain-containing protein n=1 Tax=Ruminococcus sp. TaxID=41978 RepID=UPI0025DF7D8E|nr:TNT domain-containing protein [Ruminococcus sp.]MBR1433101.1 TNT domain-containing protein [Ruminococcus sp.]
MKNNGEIMASVHLDSTDLKNRTEKSGDSQSDFIIKENARAFFRELSRNSPTKEKENPQDIDNAEIQQLIENTAFDLNTAINDVTSISDEEIIQIEENDPGYVNEDVLDYDNEQNSKSNTYAETGSHTGAIRWGEYAVEGSEYFITLEPGTVLSRWGSEDGVFLSDKGTEYDNLQLPTVKEKKPYSEYEVLKAFPVEVSKIAKQPWNGEEKDTDTETTTEQFRTPVPIRDLVEQGYLKSLSTASKNT